ncbi:MAG: hypothetical protein RQ760_01280 [Sedimentisphaerales bacterium]|nr:hypothetical protein [Sedimentisphaerales bacterium]
MPRQYGIAPELKKLTTLISVEAVKLTALAPVAAAMLAIPF